VANEINDVKPNTIKQLIAPSEGRFFDQVGVALDAAFARWEEIR